jgi:hypothetical protein
MQYIIAEAIRQVHGTVDVRVRGLRIIGRLPSEC